MNVYIFRSVEEEVSARIEAADYDAAWGALREAFEQAALLGIEISLNSMRVVSTFEKDPYV